MEARKSLGLRSGNMFGISRILGWRFCSSLWASKGLAWECAESSVAVLKAFC